jgi:hypothetical protein
MIKLSIIIGIIIPVITITNAYAWDQDYETTNRMEDIQQENKYGDNVIVVNQKQEGILEKIQNKAEELLWGDEYSGKNNRYNDYNYDREYYEPRVQTKEEFYHNSGYESYEEKTVTVKLESTGDLAHNDYRVKVQADAEIIDKEEFEDDGRAKATFEVDYHDGKKISICVNPVDEPNDRECKKTSKSSVTFYVD